MPAEKEVESGVAGVVGVAFDAQRAGAGAGRAGDGVQQMAAVRADLGRGGGEFDGGRSEQARQRLVARGRGFRRQRGRAAFSRPCEIV